MESRKADYMHDGMREQLDIDGATIASANWRVETALRSAFVAEAPAELTARLLALAAPAPQMSRFDRALQQAMVVPVPPELAQRLALLAYPQGVIVPARSRWMWAAYGFAAILLGVILVFAAQAFGLALQQLGVPDLWSDIMRTPQQWLAQFYVAFPLARYVVSGLVMMQGALQWVLVGLIMWMVLELRTPQQQTVTARWN